MAAGVLPLGLMHGEVSESLLAQAFLSDNTLSPFCFQSCKYCVSKINYGIKMGKEINILNYFLKNRWWK